MGVTAALKARRINSNVERILGLELMAAAQGVDFRREVMKGDARLGAGTQPVYDLLREHVPFFERDTVFYKYIRKVHELVQRGEIAEASRTTL